MIQNQAWSKRRKWVAYGAGNALLGLRAVQSLPIQYVVDDTPGFAGQQIDGLEIHPSSRLSDEDPHQLFVLICANTSRGVVGIAQRLVKMGFKPGLQFVDCSVFQSASIERRLKERFGLETKWQRLDAVRGLSLALRPRNLSTIAGSWLFLELLESLTEGVSGAVAECGVYQGANALIASALATSLVHRDYDLYDSFEGLVELSSADPVSRHGEFADVSFGEVEWLFAGFPNVCIVRGRFEQTLPQLSPKPHALVYVDCDLRDPTLFCCHHFWERIVPGGYLITHDYWFPDVSLPKGGPAHFAGVREAFDQFCAENGVVPVVFPETSHAIVRKPGDG